jgi:hypothetical protein
VDGCWLIPSFLEPARASTLAAAIAARSASFLERRSRSGLGPRYGVIDGPTVRAELPALEQLEAQRIRPLVRALGGTEVEPLRSDRRALRVQRYEQKSDGFRWHRDGHEFAALLVLVNDNGGETQLLPPAYSRLLKYALYPAYFAPQLLSLFPYRRLRLGPGDLLVMRGRDLIHRGVTLQQGGERVILVCAYERPGKAPHPMHDAVARWLNY